MISILENSIVQDVLQLHASKNEKISEMLQRNNQIFVYLKNHLAKVRPDSDSPQSAKLPHYFSVDTSRSLQSNLAGCCVIEFPSFLVRTTPMAAELVDSKPIVDYYAQVDTVQRHTAGEDQDAILGLIEDTADSIASNVLGQAIYELQRETQ
ncbi:hypothetical protein HDU91_000627 [Kappamyces sp. JEL0680]|nr:hypothetical protein HDU91_000627 [Kappamyces sp. JEL0680]